MKGTLSVQSWAVGSFVYVADGLLIDTGVALAVHSWLVEEFTMAIVGMVVLGKASVGIFSWRAVSVSVQSFPKNRECFGPSYFSRYPLSAGDSAQLLKVNHTRVVLD